MFDNPFESSSEARRPDSLGQTPPPLSPSPDRTGARGPAGAPPRKSLAGCLTGCLLGASAMLLLVIVLPFVALGLFFGSESSAVLKPSASQSALPYGEDECPLLSEVWSYGLASDLADAKVVRIPLSGAIMLDEESWYTRSGSATEALAAIHYATLDPSVDGIILEIDSPGGSVTASDILWDALGKFKSASTNRAVLVHMGDLCASGGYYVSMAADEIMALPTTMTGSIGVILSSYNIRQLAEKIGIKDVSVASGDNKAMLNPFHDLTPEQETILRKMIDSMHGRFVGIVAEGRDLPREKIEPIADGRIFLASEALDLGLIDAIGYFEDAYDRMNDLLGVEDSHVVRYKREESFRDIFRRSRLLGFSDVVRKLEADSSAKLLFQAGR